MTSSFSCFFALFLVVSSCVANVGRRDVNAQDTVTPISTQDVNAEDTVTPFSTQDVNAEDTVTPFSTHDLQTVYSFTPSSSSPPPPSPSDLQMVDSLMQPPSSPPPPANASHEAKPLMISPLSLMLMVIEVTVITGICSWFSYRASRSGLWKDNRYVVFVCYTPVVHAVDQILRRLLYQESRALLFILFETFREMFTALAVVFFMIWINIQLLRTYRMRSDDDSSLEDNIMRIGTFQFHWPLNLKKTTVYTPTSRILLLMKFSCYQQPFTTLAWYLAMIRCVFLGSQTWFFIFQILYFLFSTLGMMALYAYAQGVAPDLTNKRIVDLVGMFKLMLLLLWVLGPGLEIMHYIQSHIILATLLYMCCSMFLHRRRPADNSQDIRLEEAPLMHGV